MAKSNVLSTQPYKGTQDFFPEDMLLRRYIYDVWRDVCELFGYDEYQTPLLEAAEIYRAKSGDEVGGKELFTLTDLAGRELAIRPEMTPSVTRMVARRYQQWQKPIRLFNISSFARNERPQRGRNREFTQLNVDIFGEESLLADVEILSLAIEVMEAFNAPESSYIVKLNSRKLLDLFLSEVVRVADADKVLVTRLMDKYEKLSEIEFQDSAAQLGLTQEVTDLINQWIAITSLDELETRFPQLAGTDALQDLMYILRTLTGLGHAEDAVVFSPGLVRGFDYYDGMVFEVFDLHPENRRSLFGGGRYNGLANLFGGDEFPAVGCAPGDETLALFLESWGLIPDFSDTIRVFLPILIDDITSLLQLAHELRFAGLPVVTGTKQVTIANALKDADRRDITWVLLVGEEEVQKGTFALKNLKSGEQQTFSSVEDIAEMVQSGGN